MFKFLVLGVLLCQEISGRSHRAVDSPMEMVTPNPVDNPTEEHASQAVPESRGQYVHGNQLTFNFYNHPPCNCSTSLEDVAKAVRSDYTVNRGIGAHKVHLRKVTWNTARHICMDEGGHLAAIRTIEEMMAVKSLMTKNSVEGAWVGFHDLFEEGDWFTVLDEPLGSMEWTPWSTKLSVNPDNAGGDENCAVFFVSHDGINDDNCKKLFSFVCKIDV